MKYFCYKNTLDNWCGNFYEHQVEVGYIGNISPPGYKPVYRVTVSGNDDLGYYFDTFYEKVALNKHQQVLRLDFVNFKDIKNLRFKIG